jgi:histone acetyltransferase 1
MMYFIDGSSEIEVDPYWTYFLLVSKSEKITVGFATTYQFYQNALTMRNRISQYFILPPFQKIGLGKIILSEIYQNSMADTRCIEITIEDPSDDFLCMRNLYDIRFLLNQSHFKEFKTHPKITNFNYKSFKLSKQEKDDIHRLYKFTLNRVQI